MTTIKVWKNGTGSVQRRRGLCDLWVRVGQLVTTTEGKALPRRNSIEIYHRGGAEGIYVLVLAESDHAPGRKLGGGKANRQKAPQQGEKQLRTGSGAKFTASPPAKEYR